LFRAADATATLNAVVHLHIDSPTKHRTEIPDAIERAVMRGLQRDLAQRWSSAGDYTAELSRIMYQSPSPPSARDIADLVIRYGSSTTIAQASKVLSPQAPKIPHTTPLPKRRAATHQESFATAVGFDRLLDVALDSTKPLVGRPSQRLQASVVEPVLVPSPLQPPATAKRNFGLIVLIVVAVVAIVVWIIWRFADDHQAQVPVQPDAAPVVAVDAMNQPSVDAIVTDAGKFFLDAEIPIARDASVLDANRRVPHTTYDANVTVVTRDAAPRSAADAALAIEFATLRVGAIPWGEVSIDGVAAGRTPLERKISAGRHTIEVRFPVSSPPRTETYQVDMVGGETKRLLADFSSAASPAP
jgi:hypothetical protein